MHLPSGIAPILPLAIATLLPGLSVANVVPAINNNHGELYRDSQPAISPSYSEANLGIQPRGDPHDRDWLRQCKNDCKDIADPIFEWKCQVARSSGGGNRTITNKINNINRKERIWVTGCKKGCDLGREAREYAADWPPEVSPVKPRDESPDNSDPLQDIDSASTMVSDPNKQPNTRSSGLDDSCVEICDIFMNDYCNEYPWVLNGKSCVDTRRSFYEEECANFTKELEKELEEWENTPFDFEWPAFIPEDEDEEGYQQMIDRTSAGNDSTK
ncbi:hypothetical protein V8F33_013781 [Rhypophila sp. PSN 637]